MQATCCTLPSREEQTPYSHVARNVRPSQKGKTKNHPKAEDPKIKPRKKRVGEGGTHPAEQENWEEESQNSIQSKLAYFAGSNFRHSKRPSLQERKTAAAKPSPSRRLSHPSPHQAQPKINRRRRVTK